jgi:DMSO/TMAO reductase YedYZ molybdopterin-dependent catalytic subunit
VPRRLANLALLAAIATLLVSGIVAWLLPDTTAGALYLGHRVAGVALVLALVWKYAIARRSLRRRGVRGSGVWIGIVTAALTIAAAGLGLLWTLGFVSFDRPLPYSALNLHVVAGLALAVLVVAHALVRGESHPALVTLASRRAALRALGLLAASFVVSISLDQIGLARRPTGSRHAGSFSGNAFPVTIWSLDTVPIIDPDRWRLRIRTPKAPPYDLTYADLVALPRREAAVVLDCTGGWWSEQAWSGVSLKDVLARSAMAEPATRVEVISVTGHRWTFDRSEVEQAMLATHVGGERLTAGHGYPVRLVVPSLRGFLWIKWVGEVVAA